MRRSSGDFSPGSCINWPRLSMAVISGQPDISECDQRHHHHGNEDALVDDPVGEPHPGQNDARGTASVQAEANRPGPGGLSSSLPGAPPAAPAAHFTHTGHDQDQRDQQGIKMGDEIGVDHPSLQNRWGAKKLRTKKCVITSWASVFSLS